MNNNNDDASSFFKATCVCIIITIESRPLISSFTTRTVRPQQLFARTAGCGGVRYEAWEKEISPSEKKKKE